MKRKLKVLIITSMPWREDNNIGNSYSNIFKGMEDKIEFAHIYCRKGEPQNKICHKYFQITEEDMVKSIFNKKYNVGRKFNTNGSYETKQEVNSAVYNRLRILRWEIFFIVRNIIWDLGKWKTKKLDEFVEEFEPDIIFGTLTYMPNINKMMVYLKKKYNIPLVTYAWDDVYSLKQFSLSPFFWIRRFIQRKHIRRCVAESEYLYTITDLMQKEYRKYFNKECKILYKGYEFSKYFTPKKVVGKPIKIIFMGNIGAGRWKTLEKVVDALEKINKDECKAKLYIYTLSPKSEEMIKKLNREGVSQLMDVVDNKDVLKVQQSADILLHVEPTKNKERLFYRLSFSTKIVDYFYASRCIIGLGGTTASLDYLKNHDAGLVIEGMSNLEEELKRIIEDKDLILDYGYKAWKCGFENHQISKIQDTIFEDLKVLRG